MARANAGSGQAIRPLIGADVSRGSKRDRVLGVGFASWQAVGGSRHVISAVRRWTTCSPCTSTRRSTGGTAALGSRALYLAVPVRAFSPVREGHFCASLSGGPFGVAPRTASSLPGGRAVVTVRRLLRAGAGRRKEAKKMGKLYLSQGKAGQGQGWQAGARQTDSDEQRFRRWLDIPIGSAGAEQVQEPGRGWMLVQCCI